MNYNSNNKNVIINVIMRETMIIIMTVTMMYDDDNIRTLIIVKNYCY